MSSKPEFPKMTPRDIAISDVQSPGGPRVNLPKPDPGELPPAEVNDPHYGDPHAKGNDFLFKNLGLRDPPWHWKGGRLLSHPHNIPLATGPTRAYRRKGPGFVTWERGYEDSPPRE